MSKTDPCLKCGQWGHTSSSCKRPIGPPEHKAEPFDGHDRDMHRCADCAKGSLRLCAQFVPSVTQPVRCAGFKPRSNR